MSRSRVKPRVRLIYWLSILLFAITLVPAPQVARAQDANCRPDVEPNNTEAEIEKVDSSFCVSGDLPDSADQDLFLWTVAEVDFASQWTVTLDGPADVVTGVKIFSLSSPPGVEPVVPNQKIGEVNKRPDETKPVRANFLIAPGQYIVGVSRSDTTASGPPATTGYRLEIAKAADSPEAMDAEPNDEPATAVPVAGEFSGAGDLKESDDLYAWTISPEDAASGWEIHAEGALGSNLNLTITREDGSTVAYFSAYLTSRIDAYDLVLEAGIYYLRLNPGFPQSSPYVLRSVKTARPETDVEPNDQLDNANPIDLSQPVIKGRLAASNDVDQYVLTVDAELANSLIDLRLLSNTDRDRQLCLANLDTGFSLQCKRGPGGASLSNILLPRGEYLIRVSGDANADEPYILRVDLTTAPSPGFESEPNDSEEFGSLLDPTQPIAGRFDGGEWDVYRFTTAGDPQLWDATITGVGVDRIEFSKRDGTALAGAPFDSALGAASLYDLYLTPGEHWIRAYGQNGEYEITLTPRGPPPVDGEHEANDQVVIAEPMLIGDSKTGRLVDMADADVFRFSLAAREHIRIRLDVPDDAAIRMMLEWGSSRVFDRSSDSPGDAVNMDLVLEPGDYILTLSALEPTVERYSLRVIRDDPFLLSDDQEPNDTLSTAQPLSPGQTVEGRLEPGDGQDTYLISVVQDRELTFEFESESAYVTLTDDSSAFHNLVADSEGNTWSPDQRVPIDITLYLVISGTGPYTLTYGKPSADSGPQLPNLFEADRLPPVELDLTLDAAEIAAYWTEGQTLGGTLTLTNTSPDAVNFSLKSTTSHYHFVAMLEDPPGMIEPGATITVPVTINVEPDAWANIPVQITVALEANGLIGTARAGITPTAAADPVNPYQAWPVPDTMLGGFDLASPALGAVVAGTVDLEGEILLHDTVAPIGSGLSVGGQVLPLILAVDLAGQEPTPVVGTILNPQTNSGLPQAQIRAFELRLSTDGVTFTTALAGELSAIFREQVFALPEPILATHAQLVILSTYGANPTQPHGISLGEWSVIAEPGSMPDSISRINIADWSLGGHVVQSAPQMASPDFAIGMLTPDLTLKREYVYDPTLVDWTIGFSDNRAALIEEIRWVDPDGTDPANRLTELDVLISRDTPSGPWESVGTWTLRRNSDGAVRKFAFEEPVWARYVRFTTSSSEEMNSFEYPGQLIVYEAPVGEDYRSVIGAWGSTSWAAYYEVRNPPPSGAVGDPNDAPDEQSQAAPIAIGDSITGRAHIGTDVDWYRVTAPTDDNTLTFTLTGTPAVDVVVDLYDANGAQIEATRRVAQNTSVVTYTATVTPGADYTIEVRQPPHSIVFAFDTSGSMSGYAPMVQQSLRSFANGVETGQEFVQVLAFEAEPLLETWTDDSFVVYAAINGYYDQSSSSSAETGIQDSLDLLVDQEGMTAILIITDAETSSYHESLEMWSKLDAVQPRIFAVHVAGATTPVLNEHLMQDWAGKGGYYQYTTSQAEMDRAFDRAATWLRRPAGYGLTVTSSFEAEPTATPEPTPTEVSTEPGTISVLPAESTDDEQLTSAQISDQVTIEIIFDTSGSMLAAMPDGQRRIDVARTVLTDLVANQLPPGVPVALRVFGNEPESCDTSLLVPVQPLDPAAMAETIQAIEPVNLVKTPLGASLEQVANDLADVDGPKIVIMVTDGEETCGGDPGAAIQSLIDQGIDVQVNIVGFALDDDALRAQFRDWAQIGNGSYFDATNAAELDEAIAKAVQAPFRVLDADGAEAARGFVGGDPVSLPPGTYTVVVLTDPEQRFEQIVIEPGGSIELKLDAP